MCVNSKAVLVVVLAGALFATRSRAETLHVPSEYPTIQSAIQAARMSGDEIIVAPGTYRDRERLDLLGKAVRLRSSDGPDVTLLEGYAITFARKEGPDTIIEGFTITGSGVFIRDSSPTISRCRFIGNHGDWGGAIQCDQSSPTITHCVFAGNSSNGGFSGGAIQNWQSQPGITDCLFISNDGYGAGAVLSISSQPTIERCAFVSNTSSGGGKALVNLFSWPLVRDCKFIANVSDGAMANLDSKAVIESCEFTYNSADSGWGGAMVNSQGRVKVIHCTFDNNAAGWGGGGIANHEHTETFIVNCLFTGHYSEGWGAAILNRHGLVSIVNSTITGNESFYAGGGAFNYGGQMTITNSIIRGNHAGDLVWLDSIPPIVSFSNVRKFARYGIGNIDADPRFVDPARGDYRLGPESPCIDAGDSSSVPRGILIDLFGLPRFVDDPKTRDTGRGPHPIVDIGAHEYQPPR